MSLELFVSIIILILSIIIAAKIFGKDQRNTLSDIEKMNSRSESLFRDEFSRSRSEQQTQINLIREEIRNSIKIFGEQVNSNLSEITKLQRYQLSEIGKQMENLTTSNEAKLDKLKEKVSEHLNSILEKNDKKLEEMRKTVDEKLHETLEKRLGQSFQIVSERLELVHKGLGEMQTLASGVGDLKRVLTNVKARGTWGEIQLRNIIEQILAPGQFEANVEVRKGSGFRVEFIVKLPGRDENGSDIVMLPIDAKFPIEDYQRMLDMYEQGEIQEFEKFSKSLENSIKSEAKKIHDKYIYPPFTTDFAIMFLPVEGLYAEVLRRPGLTEHLMRDLKIVIAGPTNLAAILNSLQMGFRTLAIEKRSGEVWKLLGSVKTEFKKFGDVLEKTRTKLDQASQTIGEAATRTRVIERKLSGVEELPAAESANMLGINNVTENGLPAEED
ncbi:MAG: DNA recombination protein RmuC [Ignavibacteriales bacterium]|nr:DNA recombination protein RmuC [Ignavibacteriales bacterium]MCF8315883.1 DNA recombination protein RmuC [Ignavibacteriales bacterium]MCF8437343.1 DNA recombination protein RmuC [Ignavibacteriales bacterium]